MILCKQISNNTYYVCLYICSKACSSNAVIRKLCLSLLWYANGKTITHWNLPSGFILLFISHLSMKVYTVAANCWSFISKCPTCFKAFSSSVYSNRKSTDLVINNCIYSDAKRLFLSKCHRFSSSKKFTRQMSRAFPEFWTY